MASYNSLNASHATQLVWMKYWIVMGLCTSCCFFPLSLISWMPGLHSLKLFFLCWLLPNLGAGSQFIHDDVVTPLLQRNKVVLVRGLDTVSNITCNVMRELIKVVYHLSVDVVEQCWLMSRNADDIYVTPRLQAAINDVIAELRIARCSAARACYVTVEGTAAGADTAADVGAERVNEPTEDDIKLRILLAEVKSAERMQHCMKWASQEHLAPINCSMNRSQVELMPQRPVKPKRNAMQLGQAKSPACCQNCGHCDRSASADTADP